MTGKEYSSSAWRVMLAIGTRISLAKIGGFCGNGIHHSGIAVVRKQVIASFPAYIQSS